MNKQGLLLRLILTLILIYINVGLYAYDFKVNGLCYNKLSDSTVELTWEAINTPYTGDIVVPSYVNYNGKKYDVVSIGDCAMVNITIYASPQMFSYKVNSGLTSITIPNSITSIGSLAFLCCSGLTSITIPENLTSIGNEAFRECTSLPSVTIPNSVTNIGERAFESCNGLTSIMVSSGNAIFDSRNNCNAIIETSSNTLITGCKNTIIPTSVTSIGDYAFGWCSGLTSITIPDSVTSIGDYAFRNCSSLTSITIPNSVTSIGEYNQEIKGKTNVEIIPVIA